MLVRSVNGREFHIVEVDKVDFYLCLCGKVIDKNCEGRQVIADGGYVRCYECRTIEHARVRSRYRRQGPAEAVSRDEPGAVATGSGKRFVVPGPGSSRGRHPAPSSKVGDEAGLWNE